MSLKKTVAAVSAAALAFGLAACGSDSGGGSSSGDKLITAWGSEPQNPLVPANTNETGGGRVIDMIYSGLVYYDTEGKAHNEIAESIDLEGEKTYKIKIKPGQKFSDGSEIKAANFVKAWNIAVEKSMMSASFMEPIVGYEEGKAEMEGLKVVDDYTFTVELQQPEADFPQRLGYSAFFPLPDVAFDDIDGFGEKPVSNGPYKLQEWAHNESITIVPNENYEGPRKPKNDGVQFKFIPTQDAAYADLLSGNLDVLDQVPDSAFSKFKDELGEGAVSEAGPVFQAFTIGQKLEHFQGAEGELRRQAISMAIDREQITKTIFEGTRTPATDFSSPLIDGHASDLKGADVLKYDPAKAKELWAQADAISPWTGKFTIAYNADGGHQAWVDATTNSIKNTLGIEATGNPYPDFKSLRDDVKKRTVPGASRSGWQPDYPAVSNYLVPLYTTKASSNDGDYSSPEFDAKMKEAAAAKTPEEANKLYNEGQEILLKDLPVIPLWNSNITGGYAKDKVSDVKFNWKSVPEYQSITKK